VYKIWFERPLPSVYMPLLAGNSEPAWSTDGTPFDALPGAHAIVAGARIRYDAALLDQVPTLRVISRTGIGVDNIALPEATARGIAVCNLPDGPTVSTAEHTIALILAVTKHLKEVERALNAGTGQDFVPSYRGIELDHSRLGLVGLGRIGSRVATIARAMGMIVSAHDPYIRTERAAELEVQIVPTLEDLLRTSDIVSLHLPATPATRHLMNAERLAIMKRGAYLINAARGSLVDETALVQALDTGSLGGAGLDVFEKEPPPPDHPLLGRDNVITTPHVAGTNVASLDRMWRDAIAQALLALRGERPPHLVNPEVWEKRRPVV
jgi:D-3-phosphoglycerate dehydrogenase